jgi:hypothetical protein
MSARVRWIVLGIVLVVLGLIALYWFNANLSGVTMVESNGRRTWIVRAEGETVSLPGEVIPDDALVCVLDGADARVHHLIDLYSGIGNGKIWMETDRIENPPEGGAGGTVFDREPMGTVFILCGEVKIG